MGKGALIPELMQVSDDRKLPWPRREVFPSVLLIMNENSKAWVAMVPSKTFTKAAMFSTVFGLWILENQREDGFWGLNSSHPLLVKDSLSSTLACLLALHKWRLGDKQVQRGIGFIETCYGWAVDNKDQISPLDLKLYLQYDCYVEKLNLNLPLHSDFINS
ncbi:synthase [Datura stramonium]|uniref:Synthase n=1 Tax=Datura stramonium TaxID=4076 RepID=A0ABS8TEH1_DATST|nr:synthase [Datura stramonium]